ncbi:PF20097 family protein [Erythrobacter sp. 3-20A1M]|uniref:PF20097 family protein n=1 Tax=Erythrobacter sp. 3-20A1M TaxID=2653850 RepID=UPI00203D1FAC|nr:PF20097 family protein [Erythrobacter sp. 3-20A1M]
MEAPGRPDRRQLAELTQMEADGHPAARACGKCGGRMERGFAAENSQGSFYPVKWHPGAPDKSWIGTYKVDKKQLRDVMAYRCERCGKIEFYAA